MKYTPLVGVALAGAQITRAVHEGNDRSTRPRSEVPDSSPSLPVVVDH